MAFSPQKRANFLGAAIASQATGRGFNPHRPLQSSQGIRAFFPALRERLGAEWERNLFGGRSR